MRPHCRRRAPRGAPRRRLLAVAAVALAAAAAGCLGPTPGPTATPSPAPTATPTAPPLTLVDDLRARVERPPEARSGAPCGVVDLLDAPLGPPDGAGFGVRWPYGRVSRRYGGKRHAGEDWVALRGPSLGAPVHAVGHGQVSYAEPLGWGRDQGVVIVRHALPDGTSILSFYGHLDPPSVVIEPGACVGRGEMVGAIGRPSTTPHLHFEMRTHLPGEPGPGYWPTDPARQGWRPASATIAGLRLAVAPGVVWTRALTETRLVAAGTAADGALVLLERERRLVGMGLDDGATRWILDLSEAHRAAAVDAAGDRVYLARVGGGVRALALPPPPDGRPLWRAEPAAGRGARPFLAALPDGGVAVHDGARLVGLDRDGRRAWTADDVPSVAGWTFDGRRLVVAPAADRARGGGLPPAADAARPARRAGAVELVGLPVPGQPAAAGGGALLVYGPDGVWWTPPDGGRADLRTPLLRGLLDDGSIVARPGAGGGALVAHGDPHAVRVVALDADGRPTWDRDVSLLGRRPPMLVAAGGRVLAVSAGGEVVDLDLATGAGRRLLAGGASSPTARPWAVGLPAGRLVVRVGEWLVGFDPAALDP